MDLKDMQIQVDEWVNQFDPAYWPPLSIMAQISEESGELARELNNLYGGRVKKEGDPQTKIGSEICDLFFALICLANSHNINLSEAWDKTIGTRCERDKNRFDKRANQQA
jgi:NTP pyrophosphatase (non-canonical NTP hydrolase)